MFYVSEVSGFLSDEDGEVYPVQYGFNDVTAINETTLKTGVAGKRIRILSLYAKNVLAVTISFKSNANKISSDFALSANQDITLPHNTHGWFQTAVGEDFRTNQSLAVNTGITYTYVLI